jgi:hypothetical protein
MSCENTTVTRSNFASRLLTKAMSERTKTGEVAKPNVSSADKQSSLAIPEVQEAAGASK